MKFTTILLAVAILLVGCGRTVSNASSLKSESPPIYGIYFEQHTDRSIDMVAVADSGAAKYIVNCTHQLQGPNSAQLSTTLNCSDERQEVLAEFASFRTSSMWSGTLYLGADRVLKEQGSNYSCYHDDSSRHFLDCYYKPPEFPPHGGGVSN